jgi:sec-independent protein translocase protein TatC
MALVPFPGAAAPQPDSDHTPGPYEANSAPPAKLSSPFAGGDPEDEEPPEGRMTFLEHLDELRSRITHAVVALLVGFLIAFAFIERIWVFVFARLTAEIPGGHLVYTEPGEAFFLYIKMAAIAGLLISSPYVMYQVWLFIAPGLYANEKKLAVPFVVFASGLFVSGAAFSHYVLFPLAWRFFASFSNPSLDFLPRVEPVFSLYVKLLLALGLVFQLPMLMFVLAKLGLVTARFLVQNFKYAVLIIFVVAAVVTPDGSMVVQVVMAAPMIALYAISIAVVWIFGKKRATDDEATQTS